MAFHGNQNTQTGQKILQTHLCSVQQKQGSTQIDQSLESSLSSLSSRLFLFFIDCKARFRSFVSKSSSASLEESFLFFDFLAFLDFLAFFGLFVLLGLFPLFSLDFAI